MKLRLLALLLVNDGKQALTGETLRTSLKVNLLTYSGDATYLRAPLTGHRSLD